MEELDAYSSKATGYHPAKRRVSLPSNKELETGGHLPFNNNAGNGGIRILISHALKDCHECPGQFFRGVNPGHYTTCITFMDDCRRDYFQDDRVADACCSCFCFPDIPNYFVIWYRNSESLEETIPFILRKHLFLFHTSSRAMRRSGQVN